MADPSTEEGAVTTEPAEPTEAPGQPAQPTGEGAAATARGPVPTVGFIVNEAIDALYEAGSELRVLSAAVVLFGVAAVGIPLVPLALLAEAALSGATPPEPPIVGLAAVVAFVVGVGALLILGVQIPLLVVATVGGRVAGAPITLRQALRRSRQVFVRGFGATVLIVLATSIPASFVEVVLLNLLGPTQLALGIDIVARAAFAAPWVYVLPGIVLGGVDTGEALRRSWDLARYRGRIALTIALLGAIGQTIVASAASEGIGAVDTVLGLAGSAATVSTAPLAVIGLLLVSAILTAGLVCGLLLVQFAPQASGFYVLTRYSAGLDSARAGRPEPLFQRRSLVFYAAGVLAGLVLVATLVPIVSRG